MSYSQLSLPLTIHALQLGRLPSHCGHGRQPLVSRTKRDNAGIKERRGARSAKTKEAKQWRVCVCTCACVCGCMCGRTLTLLCLQSVHARLVIVRLGGAVRWSSCSFRLCGVGPEAEGRISRNMVGMGCLQRNIFVTDEETRKCWGRVSPKRRGGREERRGCGAVAVRCGALALGCLSRLRRSGGRESEAGSVGWLVGRLVGGRWDCKRKKALSVCF